LDKYLVEKYFKNSNVAVLLIFTALIGLLTLPFIWFFAPQVANLSPVSAALMAFSGVLYMSGMLFYLRALQSDEASASLPSIRRPRSSVMCSDMSYSVKH
jgi:predicted membrane channel-forming protein YqfA (hemolysin III family)